MEVQVKKRCVVEFLHVEKVAPTDIHCLLLNVYGDQSVDVNTVRQWVVCFSNGDSNSESSPLVHIFMNAACRLLITAGKSA